MWPALLFSTTALLFFVPLVGALREWQLAGDAKPLDIIQAHASDIRHFADRFRSMVEGEIDGAGRQPGVGVAATHLLIGAGETLRPAEKEAQDRSVRRIVIAEGPLTLPDGYSFEREVYGKEQVVTGIDDHLCAVLADGHLEIQRGTTVSRWAHAYSIHVDQGCAIQGRLSAIRDIAMEAGCEFTRINAPIVHFAPQGVIPDDLDWFRSPIGHKILAPPGVFGRADDRWITDGSLSLPAETIFRGDLVVRGDFLLGPDSQITGRIKVHGRTQVEERARIDGSLVVVGPLAIAMHCHVQGPIVSEREIEIGFGTTIGKADCPTSVTAPVIRIAGNVVIRGTVWARQGAAVVCPQTRS